MTTENISNKIAVVGMDCRFPGAGNVDEFWKNLKDGVESITRFSDQDLEKSGIDPSMYTRPDYVKKGFIINDEDMFDASFFGYSPREAENMDPQHRLFLETAWRTLEDGGYPPGEYDGSIGVFAGSKISTYLLNIINNRESIFEAISGYQTLIGNDKDYLATRVSYKLNLKGPSVAVQSACSTSLVAVHFACENLLSGLCDMALAGGASILVPQKTGYLYHEGMMFSPDGHCRAFDAKAKGMAPGNGVGVVLLKRLEDAIEDKDHIYAVIGGTAVNNDGAYKTGYTTPSVEGQANVIREAISIAQVQCESISYIETHGTGTELGDPIEIEAINGVFKTETARTGFCAIGSVKSNIGHLDAAAGIASFIKTVLSLKHGQIPPSLNFTEPNPKLDFQQTPFYVNTRLTEWERGETPRRAGVSSFGFGGTNAHVILEQAPERPSESKTFKRPLQLMALSAKSRDALNRQISRYQSFFVKNPGLDIDDICFTANAGRNHFPHRFATMADSTDNLRAQLSAAARDGEPRNSFESVVQNETGQGVAFLFTGQGSQYSGMGRTLYNTQPYFKKEMDKCDGILKEHLGRSILSIMFEDQNSSALDETAYSQPALFALEYSLARMWLSWGIEPDVVMGHSVGEYVAACISGVFSLEDGLKLIAERGRLMQDVPGDGAMFSVFAREELIRDIIQPYSDEVSLAAINGPLQTVISGSLTALEKITADLASQNIVSRRLAVSHGFHSPMMASMIHGFKKTAGEVRFCEPRIKLISNVTGQVVEPELISTPDYWCRHISEPVRFASGMTALQQAGYEQFLEIGPAPVLLAMGQQCLPAGYGCWLSTLKRNVDDWRQILSSLGNLYVTGASVNWEAFDSGYDCRRISLPTYPFERQRYWITPEKKTSKAILNDTAPDRDFNELTLWESLVMEGKSQAADQILDMEEYERRKEDLDALCFAYIVRALNELGMFREANEARSVDSLMEKGGILPKYGQLMVRLMDCLVQSGKLNKQGNQYSGLTGIAPDGVDAIIEKLKNASPEYDGWVNFISLCGARLEHVLTGRVNPLELLFPEGSLGVVEAVYQNDKMSRYFNQIVVGIVKKITRLLPKGSRLRILEIGAGTGSTTKTVLPALENEESSYVFTDVSPIFLNHAREKFSDYPFVEYKVLDIESLPDDQGFKPHDFDLVIAANVLHATRDLNETMNNVRSLLAPNGILLLREITSPLVMFDLTFGPVLNVLTDDRLRGGKPFLSPERWNNLLASHDFAGTRTFPDTEKGLDEHIILSQAASTALPEVEYQPLTGRRSSSPFYEIEWQPDSCSKERETTGQLLPYTPGQWVIFSDHGGVGQGVADLLTSQGDSCIQIYTDTDFTRSGEDKYGINPSSPDDFNRIFQLISDGNRETGIIHLWSLDAAPNDKLQADTLQRAELEGCGSLLYIVQALAKKSDTASSRLCIVTRELHGIKNQSSGGAVAQAPVSGLAKVLSREHPELNCLSIDVDSLHTNSGRVQLIETIRTVRPDKEFAFRKGIRYVPRLVHCLPDLKDEKASSGFSSQGTYMITGAFGGLGIELARWLAGNGVRFLLMMGRKAPGGDVLKSIKDLENAGAQVITVVADVGDYDDLSRGFDKIPENAPALKGVFHLAGILKSETILGHGHEEFLEILAPKAAGSWNLHLLTRDIPLDYFVLFSTSSTLWGIQGVGGYTAANTFMDILAHYRKGQGLPALSINWGTWARVGAAAKMNLEDRLSNQGFNSMSPEKSLECLGRLLGCDISRIGVMDVDWEKFLARFPVDAKPPLLSELDKTGSAVGPVQSGERAPAAAENVLFLDKLQKLPVDEQQALLRSYLQGEISRILHLDKDEITDDGNLIQLGMDSLIFMELSQTLSKDLQIKIEPHKVFENPTIAAMADLFCADMALEKRISVFDGKTSLDFVITHDLDNRYSPFELTDIQQAYWIGRSNTLELGNIACHVYFEIDAVDLNLACYNRAWRILIQRHEMLRAVILPNGKQKILETVPDYRIEATDLRGKPPEEAEAELQSLRDDMSHQVLDPEIWPIFDIKVSRITGEKSRIHLSMDMLIVDALSVSQIMKELHQLYRDEKTLLPPLALSFRDYVLAEKQFEDSALYRQSKAYWMDRLNSIPSGPELPLIKNPGRLKHPRFKRRTLRLEPDTWKALKAKSAKAGLTPSGFLLACYAEILAAWSRTSRFTVNMTIFNRLPIHSQVNDIIGDFTSLIMLVVDNSGQEPFIRRAQKIQEQFWKDVEHRHFSGVRVLRELSRINQSGNTTMPVIFTSNIVYGDLEGGGSEFPALGDVVYSVTQTPQVWLDHQITEQGNALILDWDAVEALFPDGLLDEMFNAYGSLLNLLANSEDAWHSNKGLVPGSQMSQRANLDTANGSVSSETLNSLFARQAEKQPDATALVCGLQKFSYRDLYQRSNRIAALVADHEVQPNTLVAVVMEKGWEQVVAVLGILNSGAAYLPIDPSVPRERLWHLLKDGEVRLVLTQSRWDQKLEWPRDIKRLPVDTQDYTHKNGVIPNVGQNPGDLAYVIHTSGSTGLPKGVMIDHRGAVNTILDINKRFGVGPEDRILALSALNFDLSVFDIFGTLAAGGTIVMPDPSAVKEPEHWMALVKQERVTLWNSVPALMQMLVEHLEGTREHIPDSLRLVLLSGDWIPLDLPGKIKASAGHAEIISLGGATEASIWSILYPIDGVDPQWNSIPYGRAMTRQSFYVLNENMENCHDWVTGQLYIGGDGLAKGYWRDKEKTEASFIRHPETGIPLYRTGDIGRFLPDGNIEFMGREDQQVKINGYRIELGEIEFALLQFHGIEEAVVNATDDRRVNRQLIAFVRPGEGLDLDLEELKAFLREKLPFYLIPAQIIALESFPLNNNGKINRKALQPPLVSTAVPEAEDPGRQSALTREILNICAGLLNAGNISGRSNFFELGGNSLLGVKFINELREKYKIDLPLRILFEESNLYEIVKNIETALQIKSENHNMEEGVI
ncbi:MAG: amino acid adenylation domain-containing protein [Desulfobacteraceae bacterium]|nr:amino acid adenylation domain-containing protein [Desulfobacteraceae bacterium]